MRKLSNTNNPNVICQLELKDVEQDANDLKAFKVFLEDKMKDEKSDLYNAISGIQYSYDLDLLVYTKSTDGSIIESDTESLLQELFLKQ